MSLEENVTIIKIIAKYSPTYVTFSSPDVLFFIIAGLLMCATFSRIFFLNEFFQSMALKTKKTLDLGINERFKYIAFYTFKSYVRFICILFRYEGCFLLVIAHVVVLHLIRIF